MAAQGVEAQAEGRTAARLIDQHRLPALDGRLDFRVPHLQLNLALCRAIAKGRAAVARAVRLVVIRQRGIAGHAVARVQLRLRIYARNAVRGKPVALLERQHRRAGRLVVSAVDGHGVAQVAQRLLEAQHRVARRADFQGGVHRRRGGINLLALRRNRVDGVEDGVRRRIAVAGAGQAVAQLERAHGGDGVRAVLAVHLVRQVAQILQALLNALHVIARAAGIEQAGRTRHARGRGGCRRADGSKRIRRIQLLVGARARHAVRAQIVAQLERRNRRHRARAVVAIHRARVVAQRLQAALHALHVVAGGTLAEGARGHDAEGLRGGRRRRGCGRISRNRIA